MGTDAYAVIMAGGKGERFWPLSTSKCPKQALSLVGKKPLMQVAVERLEGLIPAERVLVITNADIVEAMRNAAPALPCENVIGEPFGRDTAAAVALASAVVRERDENGVFCILTADHIIRETNLFQTTLKESIAVAEKGENLVTIGIQPTGPSTAFGYIETGEKSDHEGRIEFMQAKRFVEKPDKKTAGEYVDSGRFFWNSGMFVWRVDTIQKALGKYRPELLAMAEIIQRHVDTDGFMEQLAGEYEKLEKISIDYAVMEKADNIIMAKGVFDWGDIGSWDALDNYFDKDAEGNTTVGSAEYFDSTGNIVVSNERTTALVGVENLIVVQAEGATLVCARDRAQDVKKMVKQLKESGTYESIL